MRQNAFQQVWSSARFRTARSLQTLKIERLAGRHGKLIGRIRAEHLPELKRQITASALEWKEVALADAEAVRFLAACESEGIHLEHARHADASGSSESAGSKVNYSTAALPGVTIGSQIFDF